MPKKIKLPMKEIISDYESGMPPTKIGEKYGVGKNTILRRLRENGVKIRPNKIKLPIKEIISEYESGMTTYQLADKYGVGKNTIRERLRENGVKLRPSRNMKRIDLPMEEIISYYQSGSTPKQLADKYGVSEGTIRHRLKKNGVKLRPPRIINLPMEEIISEYESGMNAYQLADKYGVTSSTIRSRLRENGVKIRPPRNVKRIDLPMEEIISEYQSGMTLTQLAEKYGVSITTIYKRLKKNREKKNA